MKLEQYLPNLRRVYTSCGCGREDIKRDSQPKPEIRPICGRRNGTNAIEGIQSRTAIDSFRCRLSKFMHVHMHTPNKGGSG